MTAEQARKLCQQAGAPLPVGMAPGNFEKVKNTKRKVLDGISFRSTLEADVYTLLKSWERAGEIRFLECQPRFVLQEKQKGIRAIVYIADFGFQRRPLAPCLSFWQPVVIDAKGFRMPVYRIKAKLFRVQYPNVEFQEWTKQTLKENGG